MRMQLYAFEQSWWLLIQNTTTAETLMNAPVTDEQDANFISYCQS